MALSVTSTSALAQTAKAASAAKAATAAASLSTSAQCSGAAPAGGPRPKLSAADLKSQANLAALKKGPGYRSSFSGMVATVFGATGLVGRGVVNRFGKIGTQIILPYRGDHYPYMRFKPAGDLGQVQFTPYHLRDEESIRRSMAYSNVVVNLIGREFCTRNFNFRDVNVDGPRRLARIARESGVKRFVHISHINAREHPISLWSKGSEFLSTKWEGEQAVLEEFPDATIFRPTDLYGPNDVFVHTIFTWGRYGFRHRLPLWKKGRETVKAPLHFSDLVTGIMHSLNDPDAVGTVYEAYGPHKYRMDELITWMAESTNRDANDFGFKITDLRFSPYCWAKALVLGNLFVGTKWFGSHTIERLERTSLSDEILGLPSLIDLGVNPKSVTDGMLRDLWPLRAFAYYVPDNIEEMPNPPDPVPLETFEYKQVIKDQQRSVLKELGIA